MWVLKYLVFNALDRVPVDVLGTLGHGDGRDDGPLADEDHGLESGRGDFVPSGLVGLAGLVVDPVPPSPWPCAWAWG